MAFILSRVYDQYDDFFKLAEENSGGKLPTLMNPLFIVCSLAAYVWFVKSIGPRLMADYKPFNLRYLMLTYNAVQVVFNGYMFLFASYELLLQGDPLIFGCTRPTPGLIFVNRLYLLNKYTDLIETVIFVLRKKANQISFLHVYHHVLIITATYLATVLCPGGHQIFPGTINCFVHAVMYMYYFVSIYDAQLAAQFTSYKKRITQIQLIQFAIVIPHFAKALCGYCSFPMFLAFSGLAQDTFLMVLFGDFYYRSYVARKKVKQG